MAATRYLFDTSESCDGSLAFGGPLSAPARAPLMHPLHHPLPSARHHLAGFARSGDYGWVVSGGQLEVVSASGQRIAHWSCVGTAVDPNSGPSSSSSSGGGGEADAENDERGAYIISRVVELPRDALLAVALQRPRSRRRGGGGGDGGNVLAIFDPSSGRMLKAMAFPEAITAMTPVPVPSPGQHSRPPPDALLTLFGGCLAVGTADGSVLLLDLRLDEDPRSTGWTPGQPLRELLDAAGTDNLLRDRDTEPTSHFYCLLNATAKTRNGFVYRFSSMEGGEVHHLKANIQAGDCQVSALSFFPETCTLAVGFAFGTFQLWCLSTPQAPVFSSPITDKKEVAFFAFQIPAHDPFNASYLWVGYSDSTSALQDMETATLSLNRFRYTKQCYEDHVFNELEKVVIHHKVLDIGDVNELFSHNLGCAHQAGEEMASRIPSRMTSLDLLGQYHFFPEEPCIAGNHDDDVDVITAFTWIAPTSDDDLYSWTRYVGLLDLDRWMSSHEPFSISPSSKFSNFFTVYTLGPVSAREPLALWISPSSMRPFVAGDIIGLELQDDAGRNYWRNNMSFKTRALLVEGVAEIDFVSAQEQVLEQMAAARAQCLLDPAALFHECKTVGLISEVVLFDPNDMDTARRALMDVALTYDRTAVVVGYIEHLAQNKQDRTLRMVLAWIWKAFDILCLAKKNFCAHLFTTSGHLSSGHRYIDPMHARHLDALYRKMNALSVIRSTFQILLSMRPSEETLESRHSLEAKWMQMKAHWAHIEVVNWFVSANLLPNREFSTFCKALQSAFQEARTERHSLRMRHRHHASHGHAHRLEGALMVDHLAALVCETPPAHWGEHMYPMPSLQDLLDFFLVPDVDTASVTWLLVYFLLDVRPLIETQQPQRIEHHRQSMAESFAKCFELPGPVFRTIKAFWLLDQQKFEDATRLLREQTAQLVPRQDGLILQALNDHQYTKAAVDFAISKQISLNVVSDMLLYINILVSNGLVEAAFEYIRHNVHQDTTESMYSRLFKSCIHYKKAVTLLALPFDSRETQLLEEFLADEAGSIGKEHLVIFYLQSGRYVEAMRINNQLNKEMDINDTGTRERSWMRNSLLENYRQMLPPGKRELVDADVTQMQANRAPQVLRVPKTPHGASAPQPMQVGDLIRAPAKTAVQVMTEVAHDTQEMSRAAASGLHVAPPHERAGLGSISFVGPPTTPSRHASSVSTRLVIPRISSDVPAPVAKPQPVQVAMVRSEAASSPFMSPSPSFVRRRAAFERLNEDGDIMTEDGEVIQARPAPLLPAKTPSSILKKKTTKAVPRAKRASFAAPAMDEGDDNADDSFDNEVTITRLPRFAASDSQAMDEDDGQDDAAAAAAATATTSAGKGTEAARDRSPTSLHTPPRRKKKGGKGVRIGGAVDATEGGSSAGGASAMREEGDGSAASAPASAAFKSTGAPSSSSASSSSRAALAAAAAATTSALASASSASSTAHPPPLHSGGSQRPASASTSKPHAVAGMHDHRPTLLTRSGRTAADSCTDEASESKQPPTVVHMRPDPASPASPFRAASSGTFAKPAASAGSPALRQSSSLATSSMSMSSAASPAGMVLPQRVRKERNRRSGLSLSSPTTSASAAPASPARSAAPPPASSAAASASMSASAVSSSSSAAASVSAPAPRTPSAASSRVSAASAAVASTMPSTPKTRGSGTRRTPRRRTSATATSGHSTAAMPEEHPTHHMRLRDRTPKRA